VRTLTTKQDYDTFGTVSKITELFTVGASLWIPLNKTNLSLCQRDSVLRVATVYQH
jgi:hypothetical protein